MGSTNFDRQNNSPPIHSSSYTRDREITEAEGKFNSPELNGIISPFLFILNYVRISIMDFVKLQIIIQQVAMNLNSCASKICCHPKIFPFGNRLQ